MMTGGDWGPGERGSGLGAGKGWPSTHCTVRAPATWDTVPEPCRGRDEVARLLARTPPSPETPALGP